MINNKEFIIRLQKVIDYYSQSASSFAEKVGVQRSSISHILSGRNKPSLDFILKVLSAYPEVELYWLLNGKGNFPSSLVEGKENVKSDFGNSNHEKQIRAQPDSDLTPDKAISEATTNSIGKSIERIIIFYNDGTFKNFKPS